MVVDDVISESAQRGTENSMGTRAKPKVNCFLVIMGCSFFQYSIIPGPAYTRKAPERI
jgi:hypothetical protein